MLKHVCTGFIFCVIFIFNAFGQEKQIVFEQITNESGRTLGFITGIVQDQTGFMWFGTRNGLYRYNGYSYKLFKHNNSDSLSLPYNNIAWLYYDHNHNFWLRHMDELGVFSGEKANYSFSKITSGHYDLEVKVAHDKKGNYWIGPTGKGLMRYQPKNDSVTLYSNPPQTYSKKCWQWIDSAIETRKTLAQIIDPESNIDTLVQFSVGQQGYYLVVATGETDSRGDYDFGYLLKDQTVLWGLSHKNSMWAGGAEKNRFGTYIVKLDKGNYKLGYKADGSHGCGNWQSGAPDRTTFCGVKIMAIDEDDVNILQNGLLKPDVPETFIASNHIKSLLTDNDGNIWVLTDVGMEKFDYKKNTFDHFAIPFADLFGMPVTHEYLILYQDKHGIFWIGSQYGLIRYDHLWGRFTVFQNTDKKEIFTSNAIYSIFEDHTGLLWIGTDAGINIYDRQRNTVEKITANNKNRLYDNRIIQIFEDRSNNIWVATFEGLNRLIKSPFTYTNLGIDASSEYPVKYDEGANIWYAFGNKITRYSRNLTTSQVYILPDKIFNRDEFTGEPDYAINDMVITNDNNIWIATDNRVSRFNILTRRIDFSHVASAIVVGSDSLRSPVKRLVAGNGNELYALCPNGIIAINSFYAKITGSYYFPLQYDFIEDVDQNYLKSALKDYNGNIWIRTSGGIYQFNPRLMSLQLVNKSENAIQGASVSDWKMAEDDKGNIWYAAMPELHCIHAETFADSVWIAPFEHEWGKANVKIGQKRIYIYGDGTEGLYTFDREQRKFDFYSVDDGFVDNKINGVEEDRLGYLWLTSSKGLTKFDIDERTSQNYFTVSDFTYHMFLGNPTDFHVPSGELLLFTTNGFVAFHPDSINRKVPKVVVDKFTIRGKEFSFDSLLFNKSHLVLNYRQNFIGFEFAVLDYTAPQLNRYKYMLAGLDEDWIIADADNRKASYPALAPGKYTFMVIGSNNDKIWNEEGVKIDIVITPPWYKTIVAYIAYFIIIVASVWLYIKIREKNLKEEKHILEVKVKERTAEIMAQKEELAAQNEKIAQQHKDITDSIHYAQRIQRAILPKADPLKEVVEDFFILYRPRDIVSGDYYWTTRHENFTVIVAADCTGHGVPGAFMSMLGVAFLNEIINKEGILMPNQILDRLRENVMKSLHQTGADGESKDGMDISLYVIDHNTNILRFSGAYNPLYIIRDGQEAITLKADRMPIGYHIKKDSPFTTEEFQLQKGDCLYNSSDGYPDQFGGEDGRKFMSKNFRELLEKIHHLPMGEQKEILNSRFDEWRGQIEQIDDVIVFGVRV